MRHRTSGRAAVIVSVISALAALAAVVTWPSSPLTRGASASGAGYVALAPYRILDTRHAIGAAGPVGPDSSIDLHVTGIPTDGTVTAVALNVTAVDPTATSYITVWPSGQPRPTTSNLNLTPGINTPNLVIATLGVDHTISLYNATGTTHLLADITGYFTSASDYRALKPERLLDTRNAIGSSGPVGHDSSIDVHVTGRAGVPDNGTVTAVALTITAVDPSDFSYVTVWPSGAQRPTTSNLNLTPGINSPNTVIADVGADGSISLYNAAGTTHLLADVAGYFVGGGSYRAASLDRILDTRNAIGSIGPDSSIDLHVTGIPTDGTVTAVALNVTAVDPTATSYITVWPSGQPRPTTSNLNLTPGINTPNLVIATLGVDHTISLYNATGTTHLLADITGYFTSANGAPPPSSPPAPTAPVTAPGPTTLPPLGPAAFSFAVMPDTQNEVGASDQRMPKRVAWLQANRSALKLQWVLSSGDVQSWDTPDHVQYANMSGWLTPLTAAGIPWILTPGNHDTNAVCPGGSACPGADTHAQLRNTTTWNAYYPPTRFGLEGVYQAGKSDNGWRTFQAGGANWLVLSVELWPRTPVINWARQVVIDHPHHNVIVVTHSFLNQDGSIVSHNGGYGDNSPLTLWNALKDLPNVVMTFSGHDGTAAHGILPTSDGHKAIGLLQFHDATYNPTRIVTVDVPAGTIRTRIVASWNQQTSQNVNYLYTEDNSAITGIRFISP